MPVLFASPGSGDFHAVDGTAQMVDAGTASVSPVVSDDLNAVSRPQGAAYDIGSYEWEITTGITTAGIDHDRLWSDGDRIHVSAAPPKSELALVDLMGRTHERLIVAGDPVSIVLPDGLFIASLRAADGALLDVLKVAAIR